MFRSFVLAVVIGGLYLPVPFEVLAHSGGLNAEGCHTNRKTGDYHCHRKGAAKPARSPYQSDLNGGATTLRASSRLGGRVFANCSEARSAGAAPVREGDPGYSRKLDRDGDGIGCE